MAKISVRRDGDETELLQSDETNVEFQSADDSNRGGALSQYGQTSSVQGEVLSKFMSGAYDYVVDDNVLASDINALNPTTIHHIVLLSHQAASIDFAKVGDGVTVKKPADE